MDSAGAKAGLRAKRATGSSTPAGKAAAAAKPLRPERRRAFSAAPRSRTLESHGYIWVRQIGKGAFGRAILVRDLKHQEFVVKEVALSNTTTAEKDLARMEIKVLQKVGHPNVVRYIEHFEDSKHLYIVMEYAESGDLGKLLKGAVLPMSEEEILDYFVQMCMALQHIHSKQILHRDLKPQNLFLCKNKKVVKVGDFGISTILRSSSAVAKTQCGTPYYFSPELCQHKPYNNKSDVWSLGCLLYEMMALRRPFDGANLRLLMANICKAKYPALPSRWSAELRQLLKEMLSKDPNKRPSITAILDMDFVRKRLEQFVPLHDSVYGDAGDAAAGAVSPGKKGKEQAGAAQGESAAVQAARRHAEQERRKLQQQLEKIYEQARVRQRELEEEVVRQEQKLREEEEVMRKAQQKQARERERERQREFEREREREQERQREKEEEERAKLAVLMSTEEMQARLNLIQPPRKSSLSKSKLGPSGGSKVATAPGGCRPTTQNPRANRVQQPPAEPRPPRPRPCPPAAATAGVSKPPQPPGNASVWHPPSKSDLQKYAGRPPRSMSQEQLSACGQAHWGGPDKENIAPSNVPAAPEKSAGGKPLRARGLPPKSGPGKPEEAVPSARAPGSLDSGCPIGSLYSMWTSDPPGAARSKRMSPSPPPRRMSPSPPPRATVVRAPPRRSVTPPTRYTGALHSPGTGRTSACTTSTNFSGSTSRTTQYSKASVSVGSNSSANGTRTVSSPWLKGQKLRESPDARRKGALLLRGTPRETGRGGDRLRGKIERAAASHAHESPMRSRATSLSSETFAVELAAQPCQPRPKSSLPGSPRQPGSAKQRRRSAAEALHSPRLEATREMREEQEYWDMVQMIETILRNKQGGRSAEVVGMVADTLRMTEPTAVS